MTPTVEYKCPTPCTEANKNHQLAQAERSDYKCVDCGMRVFLGEKRQYQKTLDKVVTAEEGEKHKLGDTVNCEVID